MLNKKLDEEIMEMKLPIDVVVGKATIKAGCNIKTLLAVIFNHKDTEVKND